MRIPFRQWRHSGPIRRGLYYSMLDGATVSALFVCLEAWIVPLVQERLHAAAYVIGLLTLIPQIGFILLSPFSSRMIRALGGNKPATMVMCWVQVALLAALFIPLHGAGQAWAVPMAVGLVCAFGLTGVVIGPSWVGWVSGFTPRLVSGRFQARRMRVFSVLKIVFACLFAGIAWLLPAAAGPWGLQLILAIAVLSRLVSMGFLSQQPVIERAPSRAPLSARSAEAATGFAGFVRTLHKTDIGRWTLVWATFQGGVMISGPFYASYMIAQPDNGGMGLDPFVYSLLLYTSVVARIVFYPLAGRMVDMFGPRALLRLSFVGIFLLPLAWALTTSLPILMINEVLAGLSWACAEVAIGSLVFNCHPDPDRRAELNSYFNTVSSACLGLGVLGGTLLITMVPSFLGSHYHTLFLISMALRLPGLLLALRWMPKLRQLRGNEASQLMGSLPGIEVVSSFGRGLATLFRRPLD